MTTPSIHGRARQVSRCDALREDACQRTLERTFTTRLVLYIEHRFMGGLLQKSMVSSAIGAYRRARVSISSLGRSATTPDSAPAGAARRRDIQALRGIAVGLVLMYHANLGIPGGFIGVDLFFVISGFVISRLVYAEISTMGSFDLLRFIRKRFLRLAPNLSLVVAITLLASVLLLPPEKLQVNAAFTGIGAMLMFANGAIASFTGNYFDSPAALNPLINLWSLSVEEQFYVLIPLLVFCILALTRMRGGGTHSSK